MKRYLFLIALAPLGLLSCGSDPQQPENEKIIADDGTETVPLYFDYDTLKGFYKADFGDAELRLAIRYASEGHATGFNSVRGLQRNVSGTVTPNAQTIEMELAEPGDDKNDGVFHLSVDRQTLAITGSWKPNDPKGKAKSFTLERIVPLDDDEALSTANFANYFNYVEDSMARIFFEEDGLCRYEYIQDSDQQAEDFTGTWSYRNSYLTIEWQENPVFPSRKSRFVTIVPGDQELPWLEGEGRKFEVTMW